jgi:hypothetical protein
MPGHVDVLFGGVVDLGIFGAHFHGAIVMTLLQWKHNHGVPTEGRIRFGNNLPGAEYPGVTDLGGAGIQVGKS